MAVATFGAGCFWGVEAGFARVPGVRATAVGYAGGELARPTYHQVCSGCTGHAEVVQVDYDPDQVTYRQLLEVFWTEHDPTQLNRQGRDVGSQYRSVIFVHDVEQERLARAAKAELEQSGRYQRPIVTEIAPFTTFWRAEEHHQKYLAKRGLADYGRT
jgi:peptide-methionine (S)-S-oxide reductase